MRQGAVDDDVVDALALAFGREDLRIEHQPPEVRVHGLLHVPFCIALELDGVGIRYRDLEAGAAGQDQKTGHAGHNADGAKILHHFRDRRHGENHCRSSYLAMYGVVHRHFVTRIIAAHFEPGA